MWFDRNEIFPGDSRAEAIAKALNESQAMMVLYTSRALASASVQRDVAFALGQSSYRERVIPGLIEPAPLDAIPGALRRYQVVRLTGPSELKEGIRQIAQTLLAAA